jgi:hypothetical protein
VNVSLLHASKAQKFEFFRLSLERAGMRTANPGFILCPLCWNEKSLEELTLEHMVPSSVGGRLTTLTCKECNNTHGTTRDSHIIQYIRSLESIEGHGMMDATLNVNGQKLRANIDWADRNLHIISKASNPHSVLASKNALAAGEIDSITATFSLGFKLNNFNTAIMRSAYLILFKCFGYEYVRHEILQTIRHRIMDETIEGPNLRALILGITFTPPWDAQHYIFEALVGGMRCFVVVIRLRHATTRYLGAFFPCPAEPCDDFFKMMNTHADGCAYHKFEIVACPSHIFQ